VYGISNIEVDDRLRQCSTQSYVHRNRGDIEEVRKDTMGVVLGTATAIPFIYSFSGISAASALVSTFMCLWAIYIFPGSVYIFPPAEQADPSWEYIICSQIRECGNWNWGPDIPFLGTFVSNFRHFVFAGGYRKQEEWLQIIEWARSICRHIGFLLSIFQVKSLWYFCYKSLIYHFYSKDVTKDLLRNKT
jgi:hypothetical protein